jgi:hypothetical protein
VIAPGNRVAFAHLDGDVSDHAELADLLTAVHNAGAP